MLHGQNLLELRGALLSPQMADSFQARSSDGDIAKADGPTTEHSPHSRVITTDKRAIKPVTIVHSQPQAPKLVYP